MNIDTDYLMKTSSVGDKGTLLILSLIKATVSTALIVGAGYSLFQVYPTLNPVLWVPVAVFSIAAVGAFVGAICRDYRGWTYAIFDESLIPYWDFTVYCAFGVVIGTASLVLLRAAQEYLMPIIVWMGWFPVITIVAVTYMVGEYFPNDPIRRVIAGVTLGYSVAVVAKLIGVALVILIDTFGVVAVTGSCCIEIAFFAWYLYNDAKEWIEENKLREENERNK